MSDYIKREDAVSLINKSVSCVAPKVGVMDYKHGVITGLSMACDIVEALSSADVAPFRHGHWIKHEGFKKGVKDSIECSACGVWIDDMPRKTFCPNCGSIMYRYGEDDEID